MRNNKWDAVNMPSHELHAVELDVSQPSPFHDTTPETPSAKRESGEASEAHN